MGTQRWRPDQSRHRWREDVSGNAENSLVLADGKVRHGCADSACSFHGRGSAERTQQSHSEKQRPVGSLASYAALTDSTTLLPISAVGIALSVLLARSAVRAPADNTAETACSIA